MLRRWMLLLLLGLTCAAQGQEPAMTADAVLEKLTAYFKAQPAFSLVEKIFLDITGPRTSHDEVATNIDLQRPNLLRATQALKSFNAQSVNNDEGLYLYVVERQQFKVQPPKKSLSDALNAVAGSPMGSDTRFLAYLLKDDPIAELKARMSSIAYVGKDDLDGVSCHHLRLEEDELGWDVWVRDGDPPLLTRIVPDLTKFMDARRDQVGATTQAAMRIDLTWNLPVDFPGDHFAFDTPKDVLRVQEFQAVNPKAPQFQLLANPAPALDAFKLDGDAVSLKAAKGEVWILDFWAVWCQPCHMLMPVVHKVADAYADKGVRLYSINVGDKADEVAAFLTKNKYDVDHALSDPGHKLAGAYQLESFPMVVLVGKDGTVQTIRTGYGPGYEEQLRKDLDVLVAGDSLVARTAG